MGLEGCRMGTEIWEEIVEWRGAQVRENKMSSRRGLGGLTASSALVLGTKRNARHFTHNTLTS